MTASDDLADLLEKERAALLGGRLDDAIRLADLKLRLAEEIGRRTTDAGDVRALRRAAEENAALYAAAARGIRAAITQLREAEQAGGGSTYDRDGCLRHLGRRSGGLRQRI